MNEDAAAAMDALEDALLEKYHDPILIRITDTNAHVEAHVRNDPTTRISHVEPTLREALERMLNHEV